MSTTDRERLRSATDTPLFRYGTTAAAVAAATAVRWLFDPLLDDRIPYATFFAAVALAAWVGGLRTGLLATGLGAWLAVTFVVPPRHPFALPSGPHLVGLLMYLAVGLTITGFGEALRAGRRREAEQGERLRTTLASIGDAVITTDTAGRVTNLNTVAEALTGWANAEAVGRPLDEVFRIVNEATRRPVENPAFRALEEGVIVGLANHTVLIARDGRERPIDDSAAPIRSEGGEVVGCVLVFRDISERYEAERQLRDKDAQLRLAIRAADMIVWRWDLATGLVTRLGDAPPDPPELFEQVMATIHPADLPAVRERIAAAMRPDGPELYVSEHRHNQTPDGSWRWILVHGRVVRDEQGRPVAMFGLGMDITATKRAEAEVRASEEKFRTLFETMDEGFCVIEFLDGPHGPLSDYIHVLANPAYTANAGIPDIVGQKVRELVPDEADAWVDTYRTVLVTGRPVRFERELAATGRHLELAAFRIDPPERRQVAVLFKDVTPRKRAEAEVRGSEERFRSLVTATTQIVWTASPDGRVDEDSPTWRAFTGQTTEQWLGWGWGDAIHPDDRDAAVAAWRQAVVNRSIIDHEYRLRRHDGEYRWTSVRVVPVLEADGRIREWVGTNTDITDRKRAEAEREDLVRQLREQDRRKDEFLATLAHELRNPLAPLRNGLQVMKLAGGDPAAVEKARGMMERQVEQMARLIDDLMDLSRITRGKIALQKTRLPLAASVRNAVDTSRPLIDQQGHTLAVAVPDEPIYVDGDNTRLTQIFANLLNNAAKYTVPGGHIRLTVERQGSDAVVSVADSGVGIPPAMLDKVFDMFSQVDRSLERAQGGLGIGLNIVQRLVEMHGGSIEAHSDGHGTGSTFTVRLPVVLTVPTDRRDGGDGGQSAAAVRRRVLVVDDNRDAAISLAEMLDLMGNESRTAHDGLQAVAAAAAFHPDVILMDIGMPKLNGYDACRRIREQPWGGTPVIVACTGWGQDDDRRKSREAGFDFHLIKPVDPAELESLLAGLRGHDRVTAAGRVAPAVE